MNLPTRGHGTIKIPTIITRILLSLLPIRATYIHGIYDASTNYTHGIRVAIRNFEAYSNDKLILTSSFSVYLFIYFKLCKSNKNRVSVSYLPNTPLQRKWHAITNTVQYTMVGTYNNTYIPIVYLYNNYIMTCMKLYRTEEFDFARFNRHRLNRVLTMQTIYCLVGPMIDLQVYTMAEVDENLMKIKVTPIMYTS